MEEAKIARPPGKSSCRDNKGLVENHSTFSPRVANLIASNRVQSRCVLRLNFGLALRRLYQPEKQYNEGPESLEAGRRKSLRLAKQSSPQILLPDVDIVTSGKELQLHRAANSCDLYDHFRPLAQGKARNKYVRQPAQAIVATVNEVNDNVASASRQLKEKYAQLSELLNQFVGTTLCQDDFYESGDLLALPFDVLEYALDKSDSCSIDTKRCAAYVMRIIPAAA
ncbi:uncharacterized protein LTR77_004827 [Saxophila tyrrhenica]|uniref:Uncharacterized protein n=1 Tax=Saxophila tyrrhenica TaxID=1690608 RepID=A0AAV9PAB4_9PEZI|nr:hypothetical protein LTR77_004827 [Saxophila tyrrhenica]